MRYLALFTLFACAAPDSVVTPSDGLKASGHAIVDNVVTLDQDAQIDGDVIIVSEAARSRIQPGDFVVSDRGNGLLRQVARIDGNKLMTREAALTDVVINTDIHETLSLDPITLDLSDVISGDGLSVSTLALMVTPVIDFRLVIQEHKLQTLVTDIHFERTTRVGGGADLPGPGKYSTGDVSVWNNKWRFTQWVGPVPIVEVVSIKVAGGVSANVSAHAVVTIETECSRASSYEVGLVDGDWVSTSQGETNCASPSPSYAGTFSATLEPYLMAVLAVDFYGIAGPFLALRDGLQAQLDLCPAPGAIALSSPAALVLGADLSKLGGPRYEKTLAQHTFPIHSWGIDTTDLCR